MRGTCGLAMLLLTAASAATAKHIVLPEPVSAVAIRLCRTSCTLESLHVNHNKRMLVPPSEIPSEIVERGGEEVCRFFMDLAQGQRTCWSQTVLVVGKEASGKTALCHALLGRKCLDMEHTLEMSTVGIDTVHWPAVVALPLSNRWA